MDGPGDQSFNNYVTLEGEEGYARRDTGERKVVKVQHTHIEKIITHFR